MAKGGGLRLVHLKAICWGGQSPPLVDDGLVGGTDADDPGGTIDGAGVADFGAAVAAVSSLSAPTTSSSRRQATLEREGE